MSVTTPEQMKFITEKHANDIALVRENNIRLEKERLNKNEVALLKLANHIALNRIADTMRELGIEVIDNNEPTTSNSGL